MSLKARNIALAACSFALLLTSSISAGDRCKKSCCPKCSTPCVLKVEPGTETKHCWKVETKTICIPKVSFSWQWPFQKAKKCTSKCDVSCNLPCCAPPKLSRSRQVKRLVKHEYECPSCKYTWEAKEPCACSTCTGCTDTADLIDATIPAPVVSAPQRPVTYGYYEPMASR